MRNALQEQLLKAGLAKKQKVDAAARDQQRQRDGKAATEAAVDGRRLQAEKAERDRALAAERKAEALAAERIAQVRQLIDQHGLKPRGDDPYRFEHDGAIRTVLIEATMRRQLAKGALVVVCADDRYVLLPAEIGDRVVERGGTMALDHRGSPAAVDEDMDPHYAQFVVPDDLTW